MDPGAGRPDHRHGPLGAPLLAFVLAIALIVSEAIALAAEACALVAAILLPSGGGEAAPPG